MKLHLHTVAALALCGLFSSPTADAQTVTPVQWLNSQPQPAFKAGHTLPRLTRYGWSALGVPTRIKMCENWGFTLDFTRYALTQEAVSRLDDPLSDESQMAALNLSNPSRYPLSVSSNQGFPGAEAPPTSWTRDVNGVILTGNAQSFDGTSWAGGGNGPLYSTEAPDLTWQMAGEIQWGPLRTLRERGVPVSIVLNGAEAGLGIPGFAEAIWNLDPAIGAAIGSSPWGSGDMWSYAAAKQANTVKIVADAARTAMPQQDLYVYYTAGGRGNRNTVYNTDAWSTKWEHMRGTARIPTNELYHNHFHDGFVGNTDGLTEALNSASLEIATGDPLSYNWISGGWTRSFTGDIADYDRWAGFLKCYYTAGMIGSNTGHYGEGDNGNNYFDRSFPANAPPYWLKQLTISSHIHALFSQVENFVRNSNLLPGPAQHEMSGDVPAYEFPTGEGENSRVLARRHHTTATWLITAWAAAGPNRKVSVYIPELGNLTLEARAVGSVYKAALANGKVTLLRIDNEGATYTAVANGKAAVTRVNLAIPSPIATNRLLWLSADSEVIADGAGKVSAWGSLGNNLVVDQADVSKRPTLVAGAINGKPALRFVDSQTWLQGNITGNGFDGGLTAFVVFTPASTTNKTLISAGNGSEFFSMNDDAINYESVTSNGITRKVFPRSPLTSPMTTLMIGDTIQYGPGHANGLTGDIAEILVYKNISPQTSALVKMYLDDKYNIKKSVGVLTNGGFESPVVTGLRYTPNQAAGWFFANKAAIQANGSVFKAAAAPEGTQTAVLQGASNQLGSMSQTLTLDAGTYHLTFKAARQSNDVVQPLKFSVGQTQVGSLIAPTSTAFVTYTTSAFTVTAGKHTLRFDATDAVGDKSTFIDQIELVKTTAPATVR